jgi:tetratricopeptide (TPR) repeat protein
MKKGSNYLLILLTGLLFIYSCQENHKEPEKKHLTEEKKNNHLKKDSVLTKLNYLLRENPDSSGLYVLRSEYWYKKKEYEKALDDIERAIKVNSEDPDLYYAKANILFQLKRYQEVKTSLEKTLELNSSHEKALLKMSELLFYAGYNEESKKYLAMALKVNPYYAEAYYLKGLMFLSDSDTTNAIKAFHKAVEHSPELIEAYQNLGLIYYEKKDTVAIYYFNNVLKYDSINLAALYSKAMMLQNYQQPEKALQIYKKINRYYENFKESFYNQGYIFLTTLKNYDSAIVYFQKAIEIDPQYYQAFYNMGYAYELKKQFREADSLYEKALKIKPDYELAAKGRSRINQ